MAFTRKALAGLGLGEEAIEKVMALHGTSMADFIPKSELQDKINLLVKQQNKQLFLQADKDVAYGLVVDVMGRIREAGIDKLGVVALREDTPAVPEKKGKK